MTQSFEYAVSALLGLALLPGLYAVFRSVTLEVDDEEAVLVSVMGKHAQTLSRPGLHWVWGRSLPWVKLDRVSLRRDFRHFEGIHVNDARGTTVLVDLWVAFRIDAAEKALFQVDDWNRALGNLVTHSAISILGNREFEDILCDRTELGHRMEHDVAAETARWGIAIELVFIRNVRLLPEVSRQVFSAVAARLERAKADIEEQGRLRVAMLEASTAAQVAQLVADAKGQYPAAVGRAFARLQSRPEVLSAYSELYELSVLRPHRTVAFSGFQASEVRAIDAVLAPAGSDSAAE